MSKFHYEQAKKISYGGLRGYKEIKYIVIHYTGNKGDTAKGNASYFSRYGDGNTRNAGAHFFVDQTGDVWQTIEIKYTAWSVGGFVTNKDGAASYYQRCTNSNSVSIEMCDCATKDPSDAMIKSIRDILKYIREYCPNAKTTIRHFDVSGKCCPARMAGKDNERWAKFLKQIGEAPSETSTVKKAAVYPTKDLRYGNTGEQVKRLQKCLNKIDKAGLTVDGSYGPATLKAVRAFKKTHMDAKSPTDLVGPKTRAKIRAMIRKYAG